MNSRASSAKRQSLWEVEAASRPFILGLALIRAASGSITRAKSRGERGQPCLVPR